MKIDTTFLTRPHAFVVYGLVVLAFIAVMVPAQRNACVAIALVFVISMLTRVGRNCDKATRTIEFLNCGLCILLLIGMILK
jgi:hypothetical protein